MNDEAPFGFIQKQKLLYWALNQTWALIEKIKNKNRKVSGKTFFHKNHKIPSKIYHKHSSFPFGQISTQF